MSISFLFLMDPLERCHQQWDNSLCLGRELLRRGHTVWMSDACDLSGDGRDLFARTRKLLQKKVPLRPRQNDLEASDFQAGKLKDFDLILIRKDPPFNKSYLEMTYLLDTLPRRIPIVNAPRGLRNANEKISALNFRRWIPETFLSSQSEMILKFQRRLKADIVIKPVDEKGGKGVFLLKRNSNNSHKILDKATRGGKRMIIAQRFIQQQQNNIEKRILIMNGEFLAAYEKRPLNGEFRANLTLGGKFFPAEISNRERQILRDLKPFLLREGLLFAGIDVLNEILIEINVTSPAGIFEVEALYPERRLLAAWADFLESRV